MNVSLRGGVAPISAVRKEQMRAGGYAIAAAAVGTATTLIAVVSIINTRLPAKNGRRPSDSPQLEHRAIKVAVELRRVLALLVRGRAVPVGPAPPVEERIDRKGGAAVGP